MGHILAIFFIVLIKNVALSLDLDSPYKVVQKLQKLTAELVISIAYPRLLYGSIKKIQQEYEAFMYVRLLIQMPCMLGKFPSHS